MKSGNGPKWILAALLLALSPAASSAQTQPPIPKPDDRYKADILLIVAHPDDDTAASTYLSKAVLDEHKRVAAIFTNRGSSGPNAVGMEQSKALADVREMEARHSLAARGVTNIWFLNGLDTPTQDVLHSLEVLGHGAALEEVVRLVRLTRPEVILTWMPAYVAGENHGDHQASSVLATEAFDLAGDPTAFPEQVTSPRAHKGIANYGEGLLPWQPKKLYFFSDSTHSDFLKGHGPIYLATDISTAKKVSFSELNRQAWNLYASQLDFNDEVLRYFADLPDIFVLGKSLVPAPVSGDVWAGINEQPIPFQPVTRPQEQGQPGLSLELGGPWKFYREFYRAHDLSNLARLVPPQSALSSDRQLWIPLLLRNNSSTASQVSLAANLPPGWKQFTGPGTYDLAPGQTYPVQVFLEAPPESSNPKSPQVLQWSATSGNKLVGKIEVSVYLEFDGVPQ